MAKQKKKRPQEKKKQEKQTRHPEAKGLFLLAFSLLILLSLLSFNPLTASENWLGLVGHIIGWTLTYLFGLCSYLIAFFLFSLGWRLLCFQILPQVNLKLLYFSLFLISSSILLNLFAETSTLIPSFIQKKIHTESALISHPYPHQETRFNLGGVPWYYLYRDLPTLNLQKMLSNVGVGITFTLSAIVFFFLMTGVRLLPLLRFLKTKIIALMKKRQSQKAIKDPYATIKTVERQTAEQIEKSLTRRFELPPKEKSAEPLPNLPIIKKVIEVKNSLPTKKEIPVEVAKPAKSDFTSYELPPPSLLTNPKKFDAPSMKKELLRLAEILEETLMSFGIEGKVGEINCGPTIASFEVHPAVGVKVQKIKALENDIALNLQAKSIRIVAPIPGKAAVGVEIPSRHPQEVSFKELLLHYKQQPRKFHIPILLGKTVAGDPVMSDLAKMPHCIIAGATGSGKSVCINTVVLSILMNARPDEVKLLMIDPKKVELTAYSKLPHMIAPVITEPQGAYAALNWLVKEMQHRYEILKQLGLRNITAFNHRKIDEQMEKSLSISIPEKMAMIVMIIDEFADLMMVSSSDLETPIARIAQMARAVGIHLILATQRPSREVITGLIKANFPTRISFKVASRINSQIILDENGAESLLGNGDMLFLPPGSSQLIRAQGAYVSDEEIEQIISFISKQASANYAIKSFDAMAKEEAIFTAEESDKKDELLQQALEIVLQTKTASTTFLQRKLKIGYARAASLMDELETKGIIGPQDGAKPRKVLYDKRYSTDDDEI
jgi:DNA segregation ATPase FtsK/SpoIIIE, S-DNA-T family